MLHSIIISFNTGKIISEIQYLTAGAIIQSITILFLMEITSFIKGSIDKNNVFIFSSISCSLISLIWWVLQDFSVMDSNCLQPVYLFVCWTIAYFIIVYSRKNDSSGRFSKRKMI